MKAAEKQQAIQLRIQHRMSLREINRETGISKSTLSRWLKPYPLSETEQAAKYRSNIGRGRGNRLPRGKESKHHLVNSDRRYTHQEKGKIAEAAVLFRLCLYQLIPFGSPFDGDRVDWLVLVPGSNKILKLQVKWASVQLHAGERRGSPMVSLRRSSTHRGRIRFQPGDFDYLIGYDLYTDTCYVWSEKELAGQKGQIAVSEEAAERWDKLQ